MKTDWRKYRKSTHLCSADLDIMELEGKPLIFTIKDVKYEKEVDVSGTKMNEIFCYFKEPIKALVLNSTNCAMLAEFCKQDGLVATERNLIENWIGLKIELYVDRSVKMMGKIVDGVRIRSLRPKEKEKPIFTELNFKKAQDANATRLQIESAYSITDEIWGKYCNLKK
jgi:hypothetical protein